MRDYYTHYPRPVLWLVPGSGEIEPFYLSTLPVTNEQYEAFDPGFARAAAAPGDRDPALGLSWQDAASYCAWYAGIARKPIRLPEEAEWEHACRAGTDGRTFWGDDPEAADRFAWHAGNSDPTLVPPLDAKPTNPFGLHAMLGGVWEWTATAEAEARVLRGGSWHLPAADLVCDLRRAEPPGRRIPDAGFRIARSLR
jgi:formylglycine-generating enzyme required for sulfatase activity